MTTEYFKAWYARNKERINAKNRAAHAANPEIRREKVRNRSAETKAKDKERLKRYYQEHMEEMKARARQHELANPERRRENGLRWQHANPDKRKKSTQVYRESNLSKVKEAQRAWQKANPHRGAFATGKRRAATLQRTPLWADLEAIAQFYEGCPKGYHVDHFYPLQGRQVSGLHTLANLQYLPPFENRSKSNKMPDEIAFWKDAAD